MTKVYICIDKTVPGLLDVTRFLPLDVTICQSVSCEIKFAHAHVRARLDVCNVRAKRLLKHACNVHACGRFLGVRRAIAISHVLG